MKNNSGKTLTIFLSVTSVLFLALSVIASYHYLMEKRAKESAEVTVSDLKLSESKLQTDLKDSKKQLYVMDEKNKEQDEKINDLMDNLELEKGLREEVKKENLTLREALENESQSKEKMRNELSEQLTSSQEKLTSLESELSSAKKLAEDFQQQLKSFKESAQQKIEETVTTTIDQISSTIESGIKQVEPLNAVVVPENNASAQEGKLEQIVVATPESGIKQVEPLSAAVVPENNASTQEGKLEQIVVASPEENLQTSPTESLNEVKPDLPENTTVQDGRVLSVDKENEFLIVNMGEKHGVRPGSFLSIYRGNDYLGDVRISRVQPDMSAADFVPPFSSHKVRKNDQVVSKK